MSDAAAGTITLYDYWRSSASYRVRIALGLKGLPYRSIAVDLLAEAHHSPEHRARNPQGLVPALAIDGLMLTQSLAIIDYLDETRPAPPLLPVAAPERARARAIAQAIAMEIHPVCNLSVVNAVAEIAGGDADAQLASKTAWMHRFIRRGLEAVEQMLADLPVRRFSFGDAPGLVECCLVPQLYNARRWQVPLHGLECIARLDSACQPLEAFERARPEAVKP